MAASPAAAKLVIFISTAAANHGRRKAIRNSWFRYLADPDSPLDPALRPSVAVCFVAARGPKELEEEQALHGDLVLLDAPEGYENLWRKALIFLGWLESSSPSGTLYRPYGHVMHVDDDSFVRLDLLLPLVASWPRHRFYYGYIWDGTGNRCTAPIRNPLNKSHMPESQYELDHYPPFASGCGFVLSRDLVLALLAQPLPDYRLLDPPFGIHLTGAGSRCVAPGGPVVPVHDERIRPYRPLPTFRPDTLVQHYLRPEEMRPFYSQAVASAQDGRQPQQQQQQTHTQQQQHQAQHVRAEQDGDDACCKGPAPPALQQRQDGQGQGAPAAAAAAGAPEQLYDTLVALGLLRR